MTIQVDTSNVKYKGPTFIQDTEPGSPTEGDTWFDSNGSTKVYLNGKWEFIDYAPGDTGVFSYEYSIDQITISSPGNASNFGNLATLRNTITATSNGSYNRGIFAGGNDVNVWNTIDYVTISSPGNASDFGDLTVGRSKPAATSNDINDRGLIGGGDGYTGNVNVIDYVTISSPSNAIDFGDLTTKSRDLAATSNGTNDRGIFGGGFDQVSGNFTNIIDYVTISSPGNVSDFGDLTTARFGLAATSNGTNDRGIFGGGDIGYNEEFNIIDYVTISSAGNASDFGDLTFLRSRLAAVSNGTDDRGVFGGGDDENNPHDIIDYVTISSLGNASDFGDLTTKMTNVGATSNA